MSNKAIGLIEAVGLTSAIQAADVAVKSADVILIGYELAKGEGFVTVKIEGDVGAVKSAVESASAAAAAVGGVYSSLVIPRPAQGLGPLVRSRETVGSNKSAAQAASEEKEAAPGEDPNPPSAPKEPKRERESGKKKEAE